MAHYVWNTDLEIGEETIDAQHRWLVDTYNALMHNYNKGHGINELLTALTHLYDYTEKHFGYEESIQLRSGFPDYNRHKQLHDNFKKTALNLVEKVKAEGPSKEHAELLNATIGAWLIKHIKMEDSKIKNYMRKK
ncbi:MAG: hemerythrin family protein [Defluviitaleaceae bacterium]|nr:hemerythrin family protein [Defluviitaleaceae bacterium]